MKSTIDVFIDLDGDKFKKKKLCKDSNLSSIRIQLKLSNNIIFLTGDGYPIDIEDEEQTSLSDSLFQKDKAYKINLQTNKKDFILINIYLNNEKIHSSKYSKTIKLKDLLKDKVDLLPKDANLISDGYPVDLEDYEEKRVVDILENNNLYFESKLENRCKNDKNKNSKELSFNQQENEEIGENLGKSNESISENKKTEELEEKIYIKAGDMTKLKKSRLSEPLNEIREELKKDIPFRFKFLDNGICLEENEESKGILNDILSIEKDSKTIYIHNCEEEKKAQRDTKIIFYDSDDKFLFKQNIDINKNLDDVRELISENIKGGFIFMKRKKEIDVSEESDYNLKEIIKDGVAKLKINKEKKEITKSESSFIKFKLNEKELFANKINLNATLFEIRRQFKIIPDDAKFLKDGFTVADERDTIIEDILLNDEFILLKNEDEERKTAPPPVQLTKENIKYKIYLNEKFLKYSKFKETTTLDEIRSVLSTTISDKDQFFSSKNEEIPLDKEDQWSLLEYCDKDNKICIKTIKTPEPENTIKLNDPIDGSRKMKPENNLDIYKYPNKPFNDDEKPLCKTIMVVGETGSGKTTLLNSFLNFLMEIKYEDTFRYKIIVEEMDKKSPGESVTDSVNIYHIRTKLQDLPYLRIVDTPGFGDTRGITFDKKIIEMIRKTFTDDCDTINAICFVAKSNETRLNDFQKYIFAQVMALFGNDVGENFIAMLTFSDGQVPNIVKSLESSESIFSQILDQIEDPWYLTFNNSAIFNGCEQKFTRSFWDLGMDSYRSFLGKLKMLPQKSLVLSKKVLELRKQLETTITGLRPQIDRSLGIMENIRKEIALIKGNKDKIDQFKTFEYKYKEPKITKKDLDQGHYTSNCIACNYTCHYPCYIPDDNNKERCSAMKNGFCTVCKNKCKWDQHKNLNFIYVYEEIEKIKTSEDLRNKYVESTSDLKQSEQILKGLEKDFCDILTECYKNAENIKNCVEQLKKNSLCKNPNESFEEYIKNCILNEQNTKKPGYLDRIKGYELLKDTNDKIIKAFKGQSIFEDLDKFKEYILKEKEEIMKMYEKEEKGDKCIIF